MKRRLLASLAATTAVAASLLISSAGPATAAAPEASASNVSGGGVTSNTMLPANIQVDEKQFKIVATLRGVGKQIYDCAPGATTYTFREPAAGLFTLRGIPAGIHGKSPFWTNFDGSRVEASKTAEVAQTGTSNVPWLLLTKTKSEGGGTFGNVALIQRIDTRGGQPPAACGAPTVAVDSVSYTHLTLPTNREV